MHQLYICYRHPWRTCFLCIIVTLILSMGLLRMQFQNSPDKIWVDPNSMAAKQQVLFDQLFGSFYRIEQVIFHLDGFVGGEEETDLIQKKYLLRLAKLQKDIEKATIISEEYPGRKLSLKDLCYRPIEGHGCLVMSPLQYWRNDVSLLINDSDIKLTTSCQTTNAVLKQYAPCMDNNGVPVVRNVVFGGLRKDDRQINPDPCGEETPSAEALIITFLLENNESNATYNTLVREWEEKIFLKTVQNFQKHHEIQYTNNTIGQDNELQLVYMAQRSVEDALRAQTPKNAYVVLISYLIMFLYVAVALGDFRDPVRSRFGLAMTGILIVLLSVFVSISLCTLLLHIEITMITAEVVPFLILAIGVDNMFILSHEFDRLNSLRCAEETSHNGISSNKYSSARKSSPRLVSAGLQPARGSSLEELAMLTVKNRGPSIVVAATSECLAYLAGALTKIPALETFCVVTAVAVVVNLILQFTWFLSSVILDAKRVRAGRYDIVPWIHQKNSSSANSSAYGERTKISKLESFLEIRYFPFLMKRITKFMVLLTSACIVILSVFAFQRIPLGLEQKIAIPTSHYLHQYLAMQSQVVEAGPLAYVTVYERIDYLDKKVQNHLNEFADQLSSLHEFIQLPVYSWLNAFNQWRQMRYFLQEKIRQQLCDCPSQPMSPFGYEELENHKTLTNDSSDAQFYPLVKTFTSISIESQCCQTYGICGAQYKGDIVFDEIQDEFAGGESIISGIRGSRFRFQVAALRDESTYIQSYYHLQKFTEAYRKDLPVFIYSLYFVYYDQYTYIQGMTLQSLLLAVAIVMVSVFLLLSKNLVLSLLLVACVIGIVVSQVGFLYVVNLLSPVQTSINAISAVNLLAAIGLGVEFCCHIIHRFQYSQKHRLGSNGTDHAMHALTTTGVSIISGITLTKMCGIGVLAFAPSLLLQAYFFRMYLGVIIFGCWYGIAVLPVCLSVIGEMQSSKSDASIFLLSEELNDE